MKRVVWFTVGAVVAVVIVVEGQRLLRKATPAGVQKQAQERASDLAAQARTFWSTLTTAMSERETELRGARGMEDGPLRAPAAVTARRVVR